MNEIYKRIIAVAVLLSIAVACSREQEERPAEMRIMVDTEWGDTIYRTF